ncbi:response regulator [bacterium]|nr:response regulator [candidate division CSSED10-310 bacterium]
MAYRILIVDDDPDLVDAYRMLLEAKGYIVDVAYDGDEGKRRIAESKPDLILLDVMMKTDTDGMDLAFDLQSKAETKSIPIIFQTSLAQWGDYMQESFQGIRDMPMPYKKFLEKPIHPDNLLSAIREMLK